MSETGHKHLTSDANFSGFVYSCVSYGFVFNVENPCRETGSRDRQD